MDAAPVNAYTVRCPYCGGDGRVSEFEPDGYARDVRCIMCAGTGRMVVWTDGGQRREADPRLYEAAHGDVRGKAA